MTDVAKKVREARKRLGMSQSDFARAIGASQGSVSKWESGKEKPGYSALVRIASISGENSADAFLRSDDQPVNAVDRPMHPLLKGGISAQFVEDPYWARSEWRTLEIPLHDNLYGLEVEAFVVIGNRANRLFPEGSIVFTLRVGRYLFKIQPEDIVLVERTREDKLIELSLRRYSEQMGTDWLWPITDDPEYQDLLYPRPANALDSGSVEIVGIVVAALRPFDAAGRKIRDLTREMPFDTE